MEFGNGINYDKRLTAVVAHCSKFSTSLPLVQLRFCKIPKRNPRFAPFFFGTSQSNYQFKLKDLDIQKVKTFQDFTAFAVTVDKQVIYYGFFKPSISSSSCDHSITMDLDWTTGNKINLKLSSG
jgi:hypothetical protein